MSESFTPPLGELYAAFMGVCPEEHDTLYGLMKHLLNKHHPAVLLKAIESAMEDEISSPTFQGDRNKVVLYQSALEDLVKVIYREHG